MIYSELTKRAGVVSFFTILSRIAGLFRDIAIAYAFGTRMAADAFFVAFRIPNLLRRLFAEGALTVSFVPIFTESLKRDRAEAKKLADVSWTFLLVALVVISFLGVLFAPFLTRLIAWGFTSDPEKFSLTVFLTRVTFPYILLVSLAAWAMGALNSLKHFAAPAASSIFMNLGIIAGALFLTQFMDPPVLGLAVGVLLGGVLQLWIHFPFLKKFGFMPRLRWEPRHPGVRKIVGMMIPASFGAAVYQFNVIIITLIASFLPAGSVSYLWYADRLMEFPLGIWGIAMATVLLPSLSDHAVEKDMEGFKATFCYGLRMVLFLTLPAAVGLIALSEPIVSVLFEHGTFDHQATLETASTVIYFSIGLPFIASVRVTSNAFFSFQDSRTPVKSACWAVLINLILSLVLIRPMRHNGLALAVSLSALFNLGFQLFFLRKKIGCFGMRKSFKGICRIVFSSALMIGFILFLRETTFMRNLEAETPLVSLVILIFIGFLAFLLFEFFLKGEELREFLKILKRKTASIPPSVGE